MGIIVSYCGFIGVFEIIENYIDLQGKFSQKRSILDVWLCSDYAWEVFTLSTDNNI